MDKENSEKDYIPEQLEDEDFETEKAEMKKVGDAHYVRCHSIEV